MTLYLHFSILCLVRSRFFEYNSSNQASAALSSAGTVPVCGAVLTYRGHLLAEAVCSG